MYILLYYIILYVYVDKESFSLDVNDGFDDSILFEADLV